MIIYHHANVLVFLALASSTLVGLALECQATDDGGQDEKIRRAKWDWLSECRRQLGDHMLGKATPEETAETLRRLHETMPQVIEDSSEEWQKKRTELARLIDIAKVDEQCIVDYAFQRNSSGTRKYDLPDYLLTGWPLLRKYTQYFENKQVAACVAKITRQLARDTVNMREDVRRDMDTLMSYLPRTQTKYDWKWDKWVKEAIYQFLEATAGPLSEKITGPDKRTKFYTLFDERLQFCPYIISATRAAVKEFVAVRAHARLAETDFTSLFEPEAHKWIIAAKMCRQIRTVHQEAKEAAYEQFKKARPSRASRMLKSHLKTTS